MSVVTGLIKDLQVSLLHASVWQVKSVLIID